MIFIRTLKYAILGLVNRHPVSGYDITKEFKNNLSNFWHAKHSQIYPELKKLTQEGLITFETKISGEVLERKVYSITPQGRKELMEWLHNCEKIEPPAKDKFRLKMYFSDTLDADVYHQLLLDQLEQRKEKLVSVQTEMEKYKIPPSFGDPFFGDYLVMEGAIYREEAYIHWLEACLDKI